MNIELWSDYTCPYCYIGKRRLEMALEQLGLTNEVSIQFKSYELDANLIETKEMKILEYFKHKFNITLDEVVEMVEKIEREAEEVNLSLNFADMKQQSTFDAHRLVKYAYDQNKGELMSERLIAAYFAESAEISKHDVLLRLAKEIDLDETEVTSLLNLNNYAKKVHNDINEAEELQVQSIPFFIFDDTYALSGVQSIEVFMEVIEQTKKESMEKSKLQSVGKIGSCCVGDECE